MLKGEKQKFYLTLSLILALGAILAWQGIIGGEAAISADIEQVRDKNAAIAAYNLREEALPRDLESYNFAKDKIREINRYFVNSSENSSVEEQNLPDFIKGLEDIADETSNSLVIEFLDKEGFLSGSENAAADNKAKASDKKKPGSKTDDSYALRLNLKGGFKEFANFIARFESMPYYVYIDSVIINAESASSRSGSADEKYFSRGVNSALLVRVFGNKNFNPQ